MSLLTTLSSSQTFAKNVFFENTHTKVAFVSRCFSCVWKEIPDISTNGQTSTADHDFQGPNAKDLEESLAFQALDETIGSRKRVTAWNCLSGLRSGRVRWIPALKCNAFWPKTCRRIIQVQYCLFSIAPEGRIMLHLFLLPVMHWEKKTVNGTNGDRQTFRSGLCGHQQRCQCSKNVQTCDVFTGTCLYIEAMGTCIHYSAELETPFRIAH